MNKLNSPRKKKTLETKEKILNAALKILKKYGYEYLTIRNICEESKTSTGTFYHHFKNKDEVLYYFIVEGYFKYKEIHQNFEDDKDVRNILLEMYSVYNSFCAENGIEFLSEYYSTKNQCLNTSNQSLGEEYINISLYGSSLLELEKAKERGYLKADIDAKEVADDLCTINKGVIFNWCLGRASFDLPSTGVRIMKRYISSCLTEKYYNEFENK